MDVSYVIREPLVLSANNSSDDDINDPLAAYKIGTYLRNNPQKHYLVFAKVPSKNLMYHLKPILAAGNVEIVPQDEKDAFLKEARSSKDTE